MGREGSKASFTALGFQINKSKTKYGRALVMQTHNNTDFVGVWKKILFYFYIMPQITKPYRCSS